MWGNPWPELIDDVILWDPDNNSVCAIFLFHFMDRNLHIVTEFVGSAGKDIPEVYTDPPHFGMHVGHALCDQEEARRIFEGQVAYRRGIYVDHTDHAVHWHRRQWQYPSEWDRNGVLTITIHTDETCSPSVRIEK